MIHNLILKRSINILQYALRLKADEQFLVLTDGTVEKNLIDIISLAGTALGANVVVMKYTPRRYMFERDFCLFGGAWKLDNILSPIIGTALKSANCAIVLNSDMDIFFSSYLKESLSEGTRIILLCYITNPDRFLRLMPETPDEISAVKQTTEKYYNIMKGAKRARLWSTGGTDIEVRLGENKAGCSTGVTEGQGGGFVGGMELLPAGQVICCPDKGSANGKIVLDRSLMAHEYTKLYEPIEIEVKNGYVTGITGGNEAERFKSFLENFNDHEIYNVTELGIGTNPRCRFAGICAPAEDTHTKGMATLAFGNDTHLGGKTKASCHIDSTMWNPSLELDDRLVVDCGKLLE